MAARDAVREIVATAIVDAQGDTQPDAIDNARIDADAVLLALEAMDHLTLMVWITEAT